jgi:WD40 repeat protein
VSDDLQDFALWDTAADRSTTAWGAVQGLGWAGRDTLTGFSRERRQVEYYDAATGAVVEGDRVPLDADHAWPSAGGRRLYVGFSSGDVWTVDVATRRRLGATIRAGGFPLSVSATGDGTRVVVTAFRGGGPVTTVHDGSSGREIDRGLDGATLTSVSADGVLVGASGGQITRYDLATLTPVTSFPAARGEINSLQFSRDGAILLATSNDQTVSLYDVVSGTRLGDPIQTAAPFIVPGFLHPDGRTVAITAREGVALWDVEPAHLLEAACRTAGRNLTRGEWATYLEHLGDYRTTC